MAHRINNKPSGIILSSLLGDFNISVDGQYVDVTLTGPGGINVLTERYYTNNSSVILYDLSSLIEEEMRSSAYTLANYTLRVYSDTTTNKADSCTMRILYFDRLAFNPDIPTFLSENFLTTLSMRRVAPDSTLSLFLYAEKGECLEYFVSYTAQKNSGAKFSHSFYMDSDRSATTADIYQLNLPISTIIADAASFATSRLRDVTILSFTISCGQRSITCFVYPGLENVTSFCFRNCFNVWDILALPATTTTKTTVERSTAVVNGTSEFYNQSATKAYEVTVGPLTSDEASWIDQLLTSYDVMRIEYEQTNPDDPYIFAPIIITDSTCEISDTDEKLNTVKFTWRYPDHRPMLPLTASPGIFTSPYNIVFS